MQLTMNLTNFERKNKNFLLLREFFDCDFDWDYFGATSLSCSGWLLRNNLKKTFFVKCFFLDCVPFFLKKSIKKVCKCFYSIIISRVVGGLEQKVVTLRSSWHLFKKRSLVLSVFQKNILGYLSYKKWSLGPKHVSGAMVGKTCLIFCMKGTPKSGAHLEFWRLRHKKFFAHFYHVLLKKVIKILYKSGKLDKFVLNKEYIVSNFKIFCP